MRVTGDFLIRTEPLQALVANDNHFGDADVVTTYLTMAELTAALAIAPRAMTVHRERQQLAHHCSSPCFARSVRQTALARGVQPHPFRVVESTVQTESAQHNSHNASAIARPCYDPKSERIAFCRNR